MLRKFWQKQRKIKKTKTPYGLDCSDKITDEIAALDAPRPGILPIGLPERGESQPLDPPGIKPMAVAGEFIAAGSTVKIELGTPGNAFVYASRTGDALPLHLPGMALEVHAVSDGESIITRGHEDPDDSAIRRAARRWGADAGILPGGGAVDAC